jgi:hypothetical protein
MKTLNDILPHLFILLGIASLCLSFILVVSIGLICALERSDMIAIRGDNPFARTDAAAQHHQPDCDCYHCFNRRCAMADEKCSMLNAQ